MATDDYCKKYEILYICLQEIIKESEQRVIRDNPDALFENNVNFFVKSYLINICTYLEAYLQDVTFAHSCEINGRLKNAKVPHNYIFWKIFGEVKEKDLRFGAANFPASKKEISDGISANPYKTIKTFKLLGIDLTSSEAFQKNKELVNYVVTKRNNIIHHNDKAADISFSDLLLYVNVFSEYMKSVSAAIQSGSNST